MHKSRNYHESKLKNKYYDVISYLNAFKFSIKYYMTYTNVLYIIFYIYALRIIYFSYKLCVRENFYMYVQYIILYVYIYFLCTFVVHVYEYLLLVFQK